MKLKFCILTQYYPPEIGAPQNRLSELSVHLKNIGHEVNVLTAMPNYPFGKSIRVTMGFANMKLLME